MPIWFLYLIFDNYDIIIIWVAVKGILLKIQHNETQSIYPEGYEHVEHMQHNSHQILLLAKNKKVVVRQQCQFNLEIDTNYNKYPSCKLLAEF